MYDRVSPSHGLLPSKLSLARQNGLRAARAALPRPARRSNVTSVEVGYVYWQTADWMLREGLVEYVPESGGALIELTPVGHALIAKEPSWR